MLWERSKSGKFGGQLVYTSCAAPNLTILDEWRERVKEKERVLIEEKS